MVWPERLSEKPNLLRGRITSESERGTDYLLKFLPDGGAAAAGEILIHCSSHVHHLMKIRPGREVWLTLPPGKLHVLAPPEGSNRASIPQQSADGRRQP
jgi:hypothetical protein